MTTASDVAKYILAHFRSRENPIINLKLQKLLYYSQGWHLTLCDTPLFNDRIEAWVHGPVVPSVFREYREFKWSPITASTDVALPHEIVAHLDEVLSVYGEYTPWDLERMSHSESPWKEARGSLPPDVSSNCLISQKSMREFFAQRVNG